MSASHIYHGPWINYGHGLIRGATITLSDRSGGLLTSFVATFITLVGVQLWKIISFAIHQIRTTTTPQDGLFHQQQAIWRNTTGAGGMAWMLLQQAWFWHGRARLALFRTLTWSLFAAAYVVAFALLAIFSSEISKSPGPQRLLMADGDTCGYWVIDKSQPDLVSQAALAQRENNETFTAATYARGCYGGSFDPLRCSKYAQPYLNYTSNGNATCPYASGMCRYGDTAAYEVTSAVLDSQVDLGINTPADQRLGYQKRLTCAPIVQNESYYRLVPQLIDNSDGTVDNVTWIDMLYGNVYLANGSVYINQTYRYNIDTFRTGVGYMLDSTFQDANYTSGPSGWRPLPEIYRDDADLSIMFLSANTIVYKAPNSDPLFATDSGETNADSLGTRTTYSFAKYIATLGCIEQYRFFNPNNQLYTEWLGANQLFSESALPAGSQFHLGWNNMQSALMYRFTYAASWGSLPYIVAPRGAVALRAQETVNSGSQVGLPPTQWHIEIDSWFDAGLASIQQHIVEFATGPSLLAPGSKLSQPFKNYDVPWVKDLCYNQIIRDTASTMSFSVLGLAVVFGIGGLIILTSLVIERAVAIAQYWFKFNMHGARAWMLDDKLHMQKAVFERAGMGKWKEGDDDLVPTTITKDIFPRFEEHQVFGPNTPDTPDNNDGGVYNQKTEYMGAQGRVAEGYVQPHQGYGR